MYSTKRRCQITRPISGREERGEGVRDGGGEGEREDVRGEMERWWKVRWRM